MQCRRGVWGKHHPGVSYPPSIGSLRFNQNQATTISLGSHILTAGGILVTSAVGNMPTTISGGTLEGPAFQDLVIFQNNPANGLTITSAITNDNGAPATGADQGRTWDIDAERNFHVYSLGTFLNAGQLNLNSPSAIGFGPLTLTGGNLDNTSGAAVTLAHEQLGWPGITISTFVGSKDLNLGMGLVALNGQTERLG